MTAAGRRLDARTRLSAPSTSTSSTACRTRPPSRSTTRSTRCSTCSPTACRLQLRARAVDQAGAENPRAQRSCRRRRPSWSCSSSSSSGSPRTALRLYRHGPLRAADDELAVAQRRRQLQRNFQGYSTRAGADIYAFGMSSISQTRRLLAEREGTAGLLCGAGRRQAAAARGYFVTDEDKIRREDHHARDVRPLARLRRHVAKLGINFAEHFAARTCVARRPGSRRPGAPHADGLEVTDLGRLFIRNIAMRFDAYAWRCERRTGFRGRYEARRNHRGGHHRPDRRLSPEAQGRAGHGL